MEKAVVREDSYPFCSERRASGWFIFADFDYCVEREERQKNLASLTLGRLFTKIFSHLYESLLSGNFFVVDSVMLL